LKQEYEKDKSAPLKSASIFRRLVSIAIDVVIFLITFCIIYLAVTFEYETFSGESGSGYMVGAGFPLDFPYFLMLLSWIVFMVLTEFRGGQSIGKRLMRIKVVKTDMMAATFHEILIRHLFDPLDLMLLAGFFVALLNRNRKRIGDTVAGTMVVKN
jgi:uncharacterized RDD family membrane protein YckC